MNKFRMFVDIKKEERWLNEMITQGWVCRKANRYGVYYFEKREIAEQTIRLDFQSFKSAEMYMQYVQLYEDFGWQYIGGSRHSSLHYWLNPNGELDELYSDNGSEKAYLNRLTTYYSSLTLLFIVLTISLFNNLSQYINVKAAYLTPNLWEKEGSDFVTSFLFETPFALLRFSLPWLFMIGSIVFIRTYLKYKKELTKNN
ncbi:DUF2812 domain-containing protein [Lysinibacillus piscis]|uniref:Membrane protein n=1 Tax=Lysinibacillus piscis TaxID=2518931 RepID=A0ABQ5NKG2_9BACI|nr:DUF2812 domain-containing protein [Lysinibacillus sp. KH24]GLC88860.1 membrane protein [Lysinibacillus sp. KH24]